MGRQDLESPRDWRASIDKVMGFKFAIRVSVRQARRQLHGIPNPNVRDDTVTPPSNGRESDD
jgi:hypothetical protein